MRALFIELPAFERVRGDLLEDDAYRALQEFLLLQPEAGDLIPGAGGLRKLRFGSQIHGRGKRGGLRVIYFWWQRGREFWLFTMYEKGEMADLTPSQRRALKLMIKSELKAREPT